MIKIFEILSEYRWTTATGIAEKLSVDERTIYRYIREIDLTFSPYEVIVSGNEGYKLANADFVDIFNRKGDYITVAAIQSSAVGSLLKKKTLFSEQLLKKIIERLELQRTIPEPVLRPVMQALMEERGLIMQYKSLEQEQIECVPLTLVYRLGRPYLIVFELVNNKNITLSIDKVISVNTTVLTIQSEVIQCQLDKVKESWGIMVSDDPIEVSFSISEAIQPYFESTPIHSSQVLTKDNRRNIITMSIHNPSEFNRWVLQYGKHIKVLSPQIVIDQLRSYLSSINNHYDI